MAIVATTTRRTAADSATTGQHGATAQPTETSATATTQGQPHADITREEHRRLGTPPPADFSPGVAAPDGNAPDGCEHDVVREATENPADDVGGAGEPRYRYYPTPGLVAPPSTDGGRPACAGRHDLDWDEGTDAAACRAVCRGCPVRAQCLAQAMENREPCGIWGGLTVQERIDLARRQDRPGPATLPPHGDNRRYCRHHCRCQSCLDAHAAYERQQREKRRQGTRQGRSSSSQQARPRAGRTGRSDGDGQRHA